MKNTFTEFWAFLKKPAILKLNKDKAALKRDFLWLLLLDIVVATGIAVTYYFLVKFKLVNEYQQKTDLIKEIGYLRHFNNSMHTCSTYRRVFI